MVKVEFLVGRTVSESFDVDEVAVHVRVVQSAEGHVWGGVANMLIYYAGAGRGGTFIHKPPC